MTRDTGAQDSDGLKTPRTTLRRKPNRGSHDWETIAAILDYERPQRSGLGVNIRCYNSVH